MVWLLLGACVLSLVLRETVDAIAIAVILVLNALIGFLQEYRAEKAVDALRAMTAPHARVVRDGRTVSIPARDMVPGDLLILEAGDLVAADARVIEAHLLATNEAPLTGESLPVDKDTRPVAARTRRWPSGTIASSWAPRWRRAPEAPRSWPPAPPPSWARSRAC